MIGGVNAANNPNIHEFDWYINEYKKIGVPTILVQIKPEKLKHGDLVQTMERGILTYNNIDSDGYIRLYDYQNNWKCSQDSFKKQYTGYALLINHYNQEKKS